MSENAHPIAAFLIQGLRGEHEITKKVIRALPDGKLSWRPHEKAWTAGELALHIAGSEVWFLKGIADGKFEMEAPPKAPASVAEVLSFYEKQFAAELGRVEALSPEALSRNLNFLNVFNFPAFVYLGFASNHSIHHRGQLSTYLRAMGEKVPSIYGGSADEPFEVPQEAAAG